MAEVSAVFTPILTGAGKLQIERLTNVSMLVAEPLAVQKLSETVAAVTFTLPAEDSVVHIAL